MKKYLALAWAFSLLACAKFETEEYDGPIYSLPDYETLEYELSEERDLLNALKNYISLFGDSDSETNWNSCRFNPDNILFTHISHEDRHCFYNAASDISDHCIIARRNTKSTKTCFYNYKKYMPAEFQNLEEGEFLEIVNIYKRSSFRKLTDCLNDMQQTSTERTACAERVDQYLISYAYQNIPKSTYNKLKKCNSVVPEEYKEKFLLRGTSAGPNYKWFSQKSKDSECSGKGLIEKKKSFREDAKASAICGTRMSYEYEDYHASTSGCYSYYSPNYFSSISDETLKSMKEQQLGWIADFGIQNNCYISKSQLEEDNYNHILKGHNQKCSRPVITIYPNPPLEVRIVD